MVAFRDYNAVYQRNLKIDQTIRFHMIMLDKNDFPYMLIDLVLDGTVLVCYVYDL